MENCHICGMGYSDTPFCPDCGVRVEAPVESPADPGPPPHDRRLLPVVVYQAPDEIAAGNVVKVLESFGLESWSERNPQPGLDIPGPFDMYWGRVLVFEDQEMPALSAIQDYLGRLGPGLH